MATSVMAVWVTEETQLERSVPWEVSFDKASLKSLFGSAKSALSYLPVGPTSWCCPSRGSQGPRDL